MGIESAVACEGVIKDFGSGITRRRVLHGIDWQVPIGATTFLVGPSGCGKTTLISIIAGLLNATAGWVDTRVMQVIYSVSPSVLRATVGQQVDVYIEDKSSKLYWSF